jgi:ataxin-3
MTDLIPFLFHEVQDGQLCAQHALNNLLQGPYFAATDLAELAQGLDQDELAALLQGDPADAESIRNAFLQRPESNNFDDSGFFSIQVIQKALQVHSYAKIGLGCGLDSHSQSR